jgi:pimeloyl-ACP methyl ester carboxylesterase
VSHSGGGQAGSVTLRSGRHLAWTESGAGSPLLLLHAFPLSQSMWQGQHAGLAARCRVLSLGAPGFGQSSPWPTASCGMADVARDVLELLDALGLRRVTVGGCSMGGYVALALGKLAPERLNGLLLVSTRAAADTSEGAARRRTLADQAESEGTMSAAAQLVPRLVGATTRRQRPDLLASLEREVARVPPRSYAALQRGMADRPDRQSELMALGVPALIVAGEEDEIVPVEDSRQWQQTVPGSTFVRVAGAGHLVNLERGEEFDEIVAGFMARVGGV